jgi:hypothetical protein
MVRYEEDLKTRYAVYQSDCLHVSAKYKRSSYAFSDVYSLGRQFAGQQCCELARVSIPLVLPVVH